MSDTDAPALRRVVLVSLCAQLDDSFSMQRSGSLDFYQHPAMYWIRYARRRERVDGCDPVRNHDTQETCP